MNIFRIQNSFILTIFGASGDLAKLKIFPALYNMAKQKRLPKNFYIVGFARTDKSQEEFKQDFIDSIKSKEKDKTDTTILNNLLSHVYYYTGQYSSLKSFEDYRKYLKKLTKGLDTPHLAYFSIPPTAFEDVIKNLGESKTNNNEDLRLILEKPFGQDLESAEKLYHYLARYFEEEQVYLLDHFLGKSGVQSILSLRQTNRILNMLLKGPEIANIQITASEEIGINNRVGYFEQVGIIKDMFQSHLLQILALITMSIPISEKATSFQREKFAIISAIKVPATENNLILGQYKSYKKESGVAKNSNTETFAAIKLFIDQEPWYKVPIFIRTGKKMSKKHTYIVVEFKKFEFQKNNEEPNLLIVEMGPEEKISIRLVNKYRSGESHYETITTSESLACGGEYCLPEHAVLLLDVLRKNRVHFLSFPEIIASWQVTDTLSKIMKKNKINPIIYDDNSSGPKEQNIITAKNQFIWHEIS